MLKLIFNFGLSSSSHVFQMIKSVDFSVFFLNFLITTAPETVFNKKMLRRFTFTTTKKNLLPVSSSVLSSIKLFQTTSSDQSQKNTTTNNDDDDFVADSAFLNMMEENNNNNNDNSNSSNLVPVQPLGIERFPNVPEGTRFSRLNNVVTSQPAPNVPTQRKASLDAPEMDEVTSLLQREEMIEQMGREGLSMSDAQMKLGLTSSSAMNKGETEGEAATATKSSSSLLVVVFFCD